MKGRQHRCGTAALPCDWKTRQETAMHFKVRPLLFLAVPPTQVCPVVPDGLAQYLATVAAAQAETDK